jgi:hypothetical protein
MRDEVVEQEGVIKFQLHYTPTAVLPLPVDELNTAVSALNAWRTLCLRLGVIGQNPTRYEGYGFGNISQRRGSTGNFLISGTQTGHLPLNVIKLTFLPRMNANEHELAFSFVFIGVHSWLEPYQALT